MLRATLRALASYKVRLALSALSIILGVAFVAGTFIFTDSLQKAFDDLTKAGQADLVIEPKQAFETRFQSDVAPSTLPSDLVDEVAALPGTAEAVGVVSIRNVTVLGPDGKPLGNAGGPGSVGRGESWIDVPELQEWKLSEGVAPTTSSDVVIDTRTAEGASAALGSTIKVLLPSGATAEPTVVGIAEPTLASAGASVVIWPLATAEELLTSPGQVSGIKVVAAQNVSQDQLKAEVDAILPTTAESQTGEQVASDLSEQLDQSLGFLNTFLLVFGLIALFVSAFLIYNTFSILVAQRSRELALTRAIGATRGQVRVSVLVEAIIVALVAATLGLLLGIGVALGLRGLFSALGAPLPGSGLVLLPRTFAVAYGIGVVVTLVSALVPARRASMIPPVAAMRADLTPAAKSLRTRGLVGAALIVIAAVFGYLALQPMDSSSRAASLLGVSALAAVFGALALAPLAARLLVPVLGAPFSRTTVGRIAVENARRNPRRTAATAGALMIGLTLISAMSVIASSTIKSTDAVVDDVIGADFVVFGATFQPFPTTIAEAVAATPGVGVATPVRSAIVRAPGGDQNGTIVTIVEPEAIADVLNLSLVAGDLAGLSEPGTVIVDTDTAAPLGLAPGSQVTLTTLKGDVPVTVVGLYKPAGFFQGFASGFASASLLGAPDQDTAIYIKVAPGQDPQAVRAALDTTLAAYPTVTLQDQVEFKAQIRDQINQLLAFIVALLVLAVLIAFLGIVNTLALSVFERTREIGLLRAVGTTRRQIRRMILVESVLIAVLGSVLGVFLGVLYGVGLQRVLADDGISELGINGGQLVMFVVVSAVGGVVAALWPAWRASKLNVLKAIATE
ncbi:MAG: putative transport system permease protein [Actinomycetota bacterium]|nr:putative transport system permease protein [Actinomycetota bacterium]